MYRYIKTIIFFFIGESNAETPKVPWDFFRSPPLPFFSFFRRRWRKQVEEDSRSAKLVGGGISLGGGGGQKDPRGAWIFHGVLFSLLEITCGKCLAVWPVPPPPNLLYFCVPSFPYVSWKKKGKEARKALWSKKGREKERRAIYFLLLGLAFFIGERNDLYFHCTPRASSSSFSSLLLRRITLLGLPQKR